MCRKTRWVYTVCCHVKVLTKQCEKARDLSWCLFRPDCEEVLLHIQYGLCEKCMERLDISHLTEKMALRLWAYRAANGWEHAAPRAVLFDPSADAEGDIASERAELTRLAHVLQLHEIDDAFQDAGGIMGYVQQIRTATLLALRRMAPPEDQVKRFGKYAELRQPMGVPSQADESASMQQTNNAASAQVDESQRSPTAESFATMRKPTRNPNTTAVLEGRVVEVIPSGRSQDYRLHGGRSYSPPARFVPRLVPVLVAEPEGAKSKGKGKNKPRPLSVLPNIPEDGETVDGLASMPALLERLPRHGSLGQVSIDSVGSSNHLAAYPSWNFDDDADADFPLDSPNAGARYVNGAERRLHMVTLRSVTSEHGDVLAGAMSPSVTSHSSIASLPRATFSPALSRPSVPAPLQLAPPRISCPAALKSAPVQPLTPLFEETRVVPPRRWSAGATNLLAARERTITPGCYCDEDEYPGPCVPCIIRAREQGDENFF